MVGLDQWIEKSEALEKENLHLRERTNSLQVEVEHLREQLDYYLRRLFGPKRERFEPPGQLDFFRHGALELEEPRTDSEREGEASKTEVRYQRRKAAKKGPAPLPEHLRRERVEWDPEPAERVCPCCAKDMERVDEVLSEELSVKPPEFFVVEHVRGKFRCKDCMKASIEKPLPARPIEQGRPSPSLLAYVVVSKYVDHLPLHRQEQIYARIGYELKRQTMDGWLGVLADLLRPIVQQVERRLLSTSYLQIDETPLRYLADEKKGKSQQGYLWAITRPLEEIVYHFTTSRSAAHPKRFLAEFRGKLQCDGYVVYDGLVSDRIALLACMAHIRRGLYEARYALPKEVDEILGHIQDLYAIERCRERVDAQAFQALRESGSKLIAAEIRRRIDRLSEAILPASKLGKAVAYARNMWGRFEATLATAEARIDSNWVENAMRPAVLGRKNWLQLGSAGGGGKRIEVFLSLAQSCRRLGANPFNYFADVIERISTHPQSRLDELTPRGWMRERGLPIRDEHAD